MKKIICKIVSLLVVFSMVFSVAGCGGPDVPPPDEEVANFLSILQNEGLTAAMETTYTGDTSVISKLVETPEEEDLLLKYYSNSEFEILSASEKDENAVVKVKVTSPEVRSIFKEAAQGIMEKAIDAAVEGKGAPSEEEMTKAFYEEFGKGIENPDAPVTSSEIEIKLVLDEEGWYVDPDDNLMNILIHDFKKAVEDSIK